MYTYAFLAAPKTTLQMPSGISGRLELVHHNQLAALTEPDVDFVALQEDDNLLVQAAIAHDRVMCAVFEQAVSFPCNLVPAFAPASVCSITWQRIKIPISANWICWPIVWNIAAS